MQSNKPRDAVHEFANAPCLLLFTSLTWHAFVKLAYFFNLKWSTYTPKMREIVRHVELCLFCKCMVKVTTRGRSTKTIKNSEFLQVLSWHLAQKGLKKVNHQNEISELSKCPDRCHSENMMNCGCHFMLHASSAQASYATVRDWDLPHCHAATPEKHVLSKQCIFAMCVDTCLQTGQRWICHDNFWLTAWLRVASSKVLIVKADVIPKVSVTKHVHFHVGASEAEVGCSDNINTHSWLDMTKGLMSGMSPFSQRSCAMCCEVLTASGASMPSMETTKGTRVCHWLPSHLLWHFCFLPQTETGTVLVPRTMWQNSMYAWQQGSLRIFLVQPFS